jgi:hypothetical protein
MKTFTIQNETNNITIHATIQDAEAVANADRFRTEAQLAKLAADWPAARLVEIWNSLPGQTPVKKFKDRATVVSRIWKAIQSLTAAEPVIAAGPESETATLEDQIFTDAPAEHGTSPAADQIPKGEEATRSQAEAPVVPESEELTVTADVTPQTPDVAPEAAATENKATRAKKTAKTDNSGLPREGSKTTLVIAMLKREGGVTLEEIMAMTQWQKHTARSILSAGGSLTKNHGITILSQKVGDQRRYSIKA